MLNQNNQAPQTSFGGMEGLKDKLRSNIKYLLESSKSLQTAIVNRKPNVIWEILADQEKKVSELEQNTYLWAQLFGERTPNSPRPFGEESEQVRDDVLQLQKVGERNASLSVSYLNAIRKALSQTGTDIAINQTQTKKANKVYGKSGRMNLKRSFLINRQG